MLLYFIYNALIVWFTYFSIFSSFWIIDPKYGNLSFLDISWSSSCTLSSSFILFYYIYTHVRTHIFYTLFLILLNWKPLDSKVSHHQIINFVICSASSLITKTLLFANSIKDLLLRIWTFFCDAIWVVLKLFRHDLVTQEAAALAATQVAIVLQSGQGRGLQFSIAPGATMPSHQEPV